MTINLDNAVYCPECGAWGNSSAVVKDVPSGICPFCYLFEGKQVKEKKDPRADFLKDFMTANNIK